MNATVTAAIGVGGSVIVALAAFWANVRNTNKTTARQDIGGQPWWRPLSVTPRQPSGVAVLNLTPETKDEPGAQNDAAKKEERSKERPKNQSQGNRR